MTATAIAQLFSVSATALLVVTGVLYVRRYESPLFRHWLWGTGGLAFIALPDLVGPWGREPIVFALQLAGITFSIAMFWRAGDWLLGRCDRPAWRIYAAAALLWAVSLGVQRLSGNPELGMGVPLLPFVWTFVRLGARFWRQPGPASQGFARRALGGSYVLFGAWPLIFPYPIFHATELAWIGFFGSGLFLLGAGVGLQLYLLEEARERERQAARDYGRLKQGFLSAVSHELRTPLSVVAGYAEILQDEAERLGPELVRRYAHRTQEAAGQLARLIDDLLDFSLLERGVYRLSPERLELGALARRVADALMPAAQEAGVTLFCQVPREPVRMVADPVRIEQVLQNLVGNALKFTPAGGRVTLQLGLAPDAVLLSVSDTGPGIPRDQQERVFDAFYQLDSRLCRQHGGAGLGLAIARALVEAHGGRLLLESRPGRGATFTARLPLEAPVETPVEAAFPQ